MSKATIENPKIFISYAWGDPDNQQRVISFATSLMGCGVDVLLDRWNLKEGNDKYAYMEKCVTDETVTNVLLLLDKNYTEKANDRKGGVGDETQIISAEIYGKVDQKKFIPIVFSKGADGEIYKPAYLQPTLHIDLSDADTYDENFQYLVKRLYGVEIYKKPELGTKPNFVEEESVIPIKTQIKLEKIKNSTNSLIQMQEFKEALVSISDKIINFSTKFKYADADSFYPQYLKQYGATLFIKNEYLELLKASMYIPEGETYISDFLEKTLNKCKLINEENSEIRLILLHELFICTVALYLKYNQYKQVGYVLGKTYFTYSSFNGLSPNTFRSFYCTNSEILDNAVKLRDHKNYYTGVGCIWIERINPNYCSKDEFVLADILCYNYALFTKTKDDLDWHWFPITYIYGANYEFNVFKSFCMQLLSQERLKGILSMFNFEKLTDFIDVFKSVENDFQTGKSNKYGYTTAFETAPILCQYIVSSDIGKYR